MNTTIIIVGAVAWTGAGFTYAARGKQGNAIVCLTIAAVFFALLIVNAVQ